MFKPNYRVTQCPICGAELERKHVDFHLGDETILDLLERILYLLWDTELSEHLLLRDKFFQIPEVDVGVVDRAELDVEGGAVFFQKFLIVIKRSFFGAEGVVGDEVDISRAEDIACIFDGKPPLIG